MQIKKEDLERKILDIAKKLFDETSYEETSMRKIASEAGISVGNLYTYFKSKEEIYLKLLMEKTEPAYDYIFNEIGKKANNTEKLMEYAYAYFDYYKDKPQDFTFMMKLNTNGINKEKISEELKIVYWNYQKKYSAQLHEILKKGIKTGEFRKEPEIENALFYYTKTIKMMMNEVIVLKNFDEEFYYDYVKFIMRALTSSIDTQELNKKEKIMEKITIEKTGIIFAFAIEDYNNEIEAVILAESIRKFGGKYSNSRILALTDKELSENTADILDKFSVEVVKYEIDDKYKEIPFSFLIYASSKAEELIREDGQTLAWLNSDTIILKEPDFFRLKENKKIGCRPVHHTLIGSPANNEPDEFWKMMYESFNLEESGILKVKTCIDNNNIRGYFNAGLIICKPEDGIMKSWKENFEELINKGIFEELFMKKPIYKIFFHQAVLSCVIMKKIDKSEIEILSEKINYPLHLYLKHDESERPKNLDELWTVRYDCIDDMGYLIDKIEMKEEFKIWLKNALKES